MPRKHIILFVLLALSAGELRPQSDSGYAAPMDIPFILSGNFGEIRRNHFHTGIDIKTQGKQGVPLKSISDGHISRIKVSPYGYGNALYIDHPDGRTSVYAHMKSFNDSISAFMKEKQYEAEEWALDFYPEPGELIVSRAEVIGLSGNSGSSRGPHLHFEIRETESEHPLNPLKLGFKVTDETTPEIKGIRVYPLDRSSQVSGTADSKSFVAEKLKDGNYRISQPIKCNGNIGLGIHTFDRMTGTSNKYGVYSLTMMVNGKTHYGHRMDELDFDTFRQVNCHKDYELFHKNRWRYHKCFPAENNTLDIYTELVERGRLSISHGDTLELVFIADDINNNEVQIACTIIGDIAIETLWPEEEGVLLKADRDNIYTEEGLAVRIPHGRIYDDLFIHPRRTAVTGGPSDAYTIHDENVPMDDNINVSIQIAKPFQNADGLIMEFKDSRERISYLKGRQIDGWYEAENKYLGTYQLKLDIKGPIVKVSGLAGSGKKDKLNISISDNMTGIDSIRVEVNGLWLRMSHNASMSRAWGQLSELNLDNGAHELRVYVRDLAGNVKDERLNFNL